ncbi:hypothetical protein ALC62_10950 [Cyphomyrmex costatus]|uniref:CCHC-type domain-containing protein n=1 Tax=Cyphomyrmex costatus TaxID=456900 RepID=A0A151ID89_9HYME|nr:hypothetical protein ALC62_10950 [Cyphomyrmex costatus]
MPPPGKRARVLPQGPQGDSNPVQAVRTDLNLSYDKGDRPPFIVFVRRVADSSDGANSRLDPIAVSRTILCFAKNKIIEIKSSGRNKVAVHFNDFATVNTVLSHPSLKEAGLHAFISSFNILRTGIIRNIPLDISENEIINHFFSQFKIISVRRLNIRLRKDETTFSPSRTILVKFRGQYLPRSVSYMHVSFPVFPYFSRVLICFSCLRYGHINADCKSKPQCERCGDARHPEPDACPRLSLPPLCYNCGREHLPSATSCPAYLKQKLIYTTATLENISYAEARSKINGLPPNPFHPSEFPTFSHSRNSPRSVVNYHDLTTEEPATSSPIFDTLSQGVGRSYSAAASLPKMAPSNNSFNPSLSNEHSVRANTHAPRNYQNPPPTNPRKLLERNASRNNNSLRDIHNSFFVCT